MAIAIILAAGKGTRMRADVPKPIVPFMGKPIVKHIIDSFALAGIKDIFLIVGHGADLVEKTIGNEVSYILQKEQNGTAHAVMQFSSNPLWENNHVFVFVGDSPLISAQTIQALEKHHISTNASCTFLTADFPVKLPYARVVKNEKNELIACIEEKNATDEELKITELLSSHFIFNGNDLFHHLNEIEPDKNNGEYYLTDIIPLFLKKGLKVETLKIDHYNELVGLNTPEDIEWASSFALNYNKN